MSAIAPPKYIRQILFTLQGRGYPAWLVGECVRDMLMEKRPHDWDVCTEASPRQVEAALASVDDGKVEAARSMGSSTLGIIFRVYLHESVPDLIRATTITTISLIGLTTMAGAVGAGGIGSFAINYGQNQNHQDIVNVCVIILLIFVSLLQLLGNVLSRRTTNRGLFRKGGKD